MFFGSFLFWGYTSIDNAFIGKFLGITSLGYYAVAYRWGTFTSEHIQNILSKVLFPAFSSMNGDVVRIKNAFLKVVEVNSLIVFPITLGLISLADYFILLVIGEKWMGAYFPLLILSVLGLLRSLESSAISVFYSLNRPKIYTFCSALILILMLFTLYPFILWKGLIGACYSVTISFFIVFIIQQFLLCRLIQISFIKIFYKWLLPLISSAIMSFIILFIKNYIEINIISFLFLIFIGFLVYFVILVVLTRGKIIRIIYSLK